MQHHSEYIASANAAPQRSSPDATQIFFFKMAHDKVFGIHCNGNGRMRLFWNVGYFSTSGLSRLFPNFLNVQSESIPLKDPFNIKAAPHFWVGGPNLPRATGASDQTETRRWWFGWLRLGRPQYPHHCLLLSRDFRSTGFQLSKNRWIRSIRQTNNTAKWHLPLASHDRLRFNT